MSGHGYLLDTNVLSDLIRRPGGPVASKIAAVGEPAICTSIIVACELRYGAAKKSSAPLTARIEELLESLDVLPLEREADRHYADIRSYLAGKGQPIGPNDLLIAGHTRALGLTLVSANAREFQRVPGLSLENWLEPASR